jgi:hypothetical protein
MYGFKMLVAFALLTTPPDTPEPAELAEAALTLRPALQQLAVQWEILDPREVRYMLTRPEEFRSDLNLLRRRYQDLGDAPGVHDCDRFPDRATISEMLAFNRAYRQHIDVRQPVERAHWWDYQAAIQETDHLYQVWETLRDARCEYYYVHARRQYLKKLRELIGEDDYYTGKMPPYVPLWRFQQID